MIFNVGASAPRFPVFSVTVGEKTHKFNGSDIDTSDVKVWQDGSYVKIKFYKSGSICFDSLLKNVDVCVVGQGATGGQAHTTRHYISQYNVPGTFYGGNGGRGGEVKNFYGENIAVGQECNISVGGVNRFTIGSRVLSANNGGGASGGNGALWSDSSGSGHAASNGSNGTYAFDSISFDGIRYAPGGGGGKNNMYPTAGVSGTTVGAPGAGGKGANNPGDGGPWGGGQGANGIVLMRIPLL